MLILCKHAGSLPLTLLEESSFSVELEVRWNRHLAVLEQLARMLLTCEATDPCKCWYSPSVVDV